MRVYSISGDFDNYDACEIDFVACAKKHPDIADYDMRFNLEGVSVTSTWWPRKMKRYNDHPLGDYVSKLTNDVLILERQAISKLSFVLGNIEILPLDCNFGDYWAVNILDVLDCIDYEKAEFKCFSKRNEYDKPRIMRFIKFAFHSEKIMDHHVFKIVDQPQSHVFVDDVFVKEVAKHNIAGFKFKLVWEG